MRLLREELQLLQEPGSYVGEVIKVMGKAKVLVKVHPEGKYVVDVDKAVDMATLTPGARVALRNDRCVGRVLCRGAAVVFFFAVVCFLSSAARDGAARRGAPPVRRSPPNTSQTHTRSRNKTHPPTHPTHPHATP